MVDGWMDGYGWIWIWIWVMGYGYGCEIVRVIVGLDTKLVGG